MRIRRWLCFVLGSICVSASGSNLHYAMQVEIDPAEQALVAEAVIQNPPASRFYLNKELTVQAVFADGKQANFRVDASAPALPYCPNSAAIVVETVSPRELRIQYRGKLSGTIAGVNQISADLTELALYANWYPIFQGARTYSFELTTDLPKGLVSATNARRVSQRESKGRVQTEWSSFGETFDIALVASPALCSRVKGNVEILSARLPEPVVSRKVQALASAMERLTRLYGPPQAKGVLRVVYSPRAGWGYSRVPLIVVSEERALNTLKGELGEARDFRDNAHELAHFWWMIADPATADDWLNEGFAEYTAYRLAQQEFGETFANMRRNEYLQNVERHQTSDAVAETESSAPYRERNRYDKAALILLEAESKFGRQAVDRVLREMYARFGSTHDAMTSDFLAIVDDIMGDDAERFFRDKLYERPASKP